MTVELCLKELHHELNAKGINIQFEQFMDSYRSALDNQREILLPQGREISNETCLVEALKRLGYDLQPTDPAITSAMEACFRPYVQSTVIPAETINVIKRLKTEAKVGLVSNFSYSKVIRRILDKYQLTPLLDAVIISGDVGWRKPNSRIFDLLLNEFSIKARDVVFVGDKIEFDVVGAKRVGMRTVLLTEGEDRFSDASNPTENAAPDFVIDSFSKLPEIFRKTGAINP